MKHWQDFLDSLSTKGGNIFVLFICSFTLAFLFLHSVHHQIDSSAIQVIESTLSGFAGALLMALSGNSSRQQMQDRVDTATSASVPKVDASKAQTVNVATNLEQQAQPKQGD